MYCLHNNHPSRKWTPSVDIQKFASLEYLITSNFKFATFEEHSTKRIIKPYDILLYYRAFTGHKSCVFHKNINCITSEFTEHAVSLYKDYSTLYFQNFEKSIHVEFDNYLRFDK